MSKAEAKLRRGVDGQKDPLIPVSKFAKNDAFSGLKTQKEHCQKVETVLSAHSPESKIWFKGMQSFTAGRGE